MVAPAQVTRTCQLLKSHPEHRTPAQSRENSVGLCSVVMLHHKNENVKSLDHGSWCSFSFVRAIVMTCVVPPSGLISIERYMRLTLPSQTQTKDDTE